MASIEKSIEIRKARAAWVIPDRMELGGSRRQTRIDLPAELHMRETRRGQKDERRALARLGERDVHPITRLHVVNPRFHHSPSRTAHTRTPSPTPLNVCSPRSSKRTPADVRANDRTVSDTSTSPGADSPLMREAMLTAPP